jgi:hypothetical protein
MVSASVVELHLFRVGAVFLQCLAPILLPSLFFQEPAYIPSLVSLNCTRELFELSLDEGVHSSSSSSLSSTARRMSSAISICIFFQ